MGKDELKVNIYELDIKRQQLNGIERNFDEAVTSIGQVRNEYEYLGVYIQSLEDRFSEEESRILELKSLYNDLQLDIQRNINKFLQVDATVSDIMKEKFGVYDNATLSMLGDGFRRQYGYFDDVENDGIEEIKEKLEAQVKIISEDEVFKKKEDFYLSMRMRGYTNEEQIEAEYQSYVLSSVELNRIWMKMDVLYH